MKISPILTLMLVTLIILPTFPSHAANNNDLLDEQNNESDYSIDAQLKFDLASNPSTLVSAILQFQDELTPDEVYYAQTMGVKFRERYNQPVHVGSIYIAELSSLQSIDSIKNLGLLQVSSANKQFFTALDTAVNTINASDVWNNLKIDGHPIDGTGVEVAVIDTGINWQHPSFWRQSSDEINVIYSDGYYYADIDEDLVPDPNEGPISSVLNQNLSNFSYSLDYMFIDVNNDSSFSYSAGDRWLGGIDTNQNGRINLPTENVVILGESKVAVLYDQEQGDVYVRGVNLTSQALSVHDYNGHGTHVASTIAGGQIGMTGRVGVAPNADLIIIRSLLNSADIIDAINFALTQDADVINMSFSSYLGFLDGTDIEDLVISESFLEYGTLSTLAAGNLGGKSKHASFGITSSSSSSVGFSVGSPPAYSFINILWNSENRDEDITLNTPSGNPIDLGTFSEIEGTAFRIEYDDIIANVFCDVSLRNTSRIIIQLTDDQVIARGDWDITISNPVGRDVYVDVYVWDNEWSYNGLRVTNHQDNTRTISSPGTSDFGVSVSAYSESARIISDSSSLGPRIDGISKPEIAAPGLGITAASISLHSLWSTRSGTSMASPQVAGIIALIRSVFNEKNAWLEYSSLIQGAGGPNHHYDAASISFGYGLADALWSIQHVMAHDFNESTSFADWSGIGIFIDDPIDGSIDPSLDINDVFVLQRQSNFYLAVRFSGVPDFGGDESLQVYWDVDNNDLTGLDGFDDLINLTQNDAVMFEWNGSEYISSGMSPKWWKSGKIIYFDIPHGVMSDRGSLLLETYSSIELRDTTVEKSLTNQWRPLLNSVHISKPVPKTYDVTISIMDQDSPPDTIRISWLSFSDGYNTLSSSFIDGVNMTTIHVDYAGVSGLLGILLNVTDESSILYYPPIILSDGLSIRQNILNAFINEDTVAVGLLSTGRLTGEVQIDGFLLVERVYLAFKSQYNFWINFSLSGDEGVYPVDVALSGFSAGEYEVYVVAVNLIGEFTSQYIKTINVVDDNSAIILGGIGIAAIVVIVFVIPRLRKKVDEV